MNDWSDISREHVALGEPWATLSHIAFIATFDSSGRVLSANERFKHALRPQAGQTQPSIRLQDTTLAPPQEAWAKLMEGDPWQGELYLSPSEKVPCCFEVLMQPLAVSKEGFLWFGIDISHKKADAVRRHALRARIHYIEKMASLGELAAGIAHELGNPLAGLSAWLEVLSHEVERGRFNAEKFRETAPQVLASSARMAKVLRSLLRYVQGEPTDPISEISLTRLLNEVTEHCSHRFHKLDITVRYTIEPKDLKLSCRESEIAQVLINVLLNAADALEGKSPGTVHISATQEGSEVVIAVEDNGDGIPAAIQEQIFEPFFSTKSLAKGTGLGLAIGRKLAIGHGGSLGLATSKIGSKFVLRLPLRSV